MPMDNRLMIPRRNYDADTLRYLNAVQLADGQALEPEIQAAVDAFVRGCKADGTWSALKASCIMCGARTISGALVPLAGAAPTGYGDWASGDYDRSSGLKGNGSTKYLDSNRAGNADGQNDNHVSLYISSQSTGGSVYIENRDTATTSGYSGISRSTADTFFRSSSDAGGSVSGLHTGFLGVTRSSSLSMTARASGSDSSLTVASQAPSSLNMLVFNRQNTDGFTDARLAFYSIGSSLDLAALDTRVSTLVAAIAAAI